MVKLSTTFVKPNANRSVCVKSGKTKYSENGGLWYGVRVEKDGEVGVYEYDKRKDKPKWIRIWANYIEVEDSE